MRPVRVCIYGGTSLKPAFSGFITALADQVLRSMPAVIVTGGFKRAAEQEGMPTDVAALNGAEQYALEKDVRLEDCFEAWIPDPLLDDRPKLEGVVRMNAGDDITIRVATGLTALGRRLAMVGGVDIVVTIAGADQHTEVIVEQSLELGIPVLPIPDAAGDSARLLTTYRGRIADAFDPQTFETCLEHVHRDIADRPDRAAAEVVALIRTAKIGRCLVLMPFDDEHDALYSASIEPAIKPYMMPLRLDRLPASDLIYTSFAQNVRSSAAVIADITALNENVMFEIGYALGCGVRPLIYTCDHERLERLPIYFEALNVRLARGPAAVEGLIAEYLSSLRDARIKRGLAT